MAINYFPSEEPDAREVIQLIKEAGLTGIAIPAPPLRLPASCACDRRVRPRPGHRETPPSTTTRERWLRGSGPILSTAEPPKSVTIHSFDIRTVLEHP